MKVDLPPCLIKILRDDNLLKERYYEILKFVNQYKPEALHHMLKHLIDLGVRISIDMDAFEPFDCDKLRAFCVDNCPLFEDIFTFLKANTEDVVMTQEDDDTTIIVITMKDGKRLKLNLNSDHVGRSLTSQIAFNYGRYVDIDLRRRKDREQWKNLVNFWVSRAKRKMLSDIISTIDEDAEYIRTMALDYLHTVPVKPIDEWNGDYVSAVTRDGVYALYLKEALLAYVSGRVSSKITMTKLTRLLRPDAEPVWVWINGTRYAFYQFCMSDQQRKAYEEYLRVKGQKIVEKESETEDEQPQTESQIEEQTEKETESDPEIMDWNVSEELLKEILEDSDEESMTDSD